MRLRNANEAPPRPAGDYVLYWMIAARRTTWNFALDRALEHARAFRRPLLVFEPLRCGYGWASARIHRVVLDGMADNERRLDRAGILYYPYVEPEPGAGRGLLAALASRACTVVTDDFPCFFLPRMVTAAAAKLDVRLEVVDSNGLLPLAASASAFPSAYAFRRFLQANLRPHLDAGPSPDPLRGRRSPGSVALPRGVASRWPRAAAALLGGDARALARLPIDHEVPPVAARGGSQAAAARLRSFLDILPRYATSIRAPRPT
jgi:deoxyribodipyrimidine photo-lyase